MDDQTKQALSIALKKLQDANLSTRLEAIESLGEIGVAHPQIIERLQTVASNDVSPEVRLAAEHSLQLLQPSSVVQEIPQTNNLPERQHVLVNPSKEDAILELLQKQNEILVNIQTLLTRSARSQNKDQYLFASKVVDVDLSIGTLANLMFKWIVASIPVGIVVWFIIFLLGGCMAAAF